MATNADSNHNPSPKTTVHLQDKGEMETVFRRFDTNGDGKISVVELVAVMRAVGSDTSEDEVKRMMEAIDTDLDGFISLSEFQQFFAGGEGDDGDAHNQELREAFEFYDQDKNGLISSAELHQILNRLGETCSAGDCSRMIKSVDTDGDGYVNFEEFKKMMSSGTR
ncbi:calcium-binding allergen Ole e 8-like [Diospyros lotus]|uniref:calcium-binding allergen Ole e 8-like n=1 Tax=Diospyros lotus TaxID=55363 RepID=UPI00225B18D6|nr:calcium-binding allergen Ole e 8-like [Diospyros lotus]